MLTVSMQTINRGSIGTCKAGLHPLTRTVVIALTLCIPPLAAAANARPDPLPDQAGAAVADAALTRTTQSVRYNGAYRSIGYPGGDVPSDQGVCTDVVVRSYRLLNIDLQKLVHEDMRADFAAYPKLWGLSRPDSNIDHRRVPNLETYFSRAAQGLVSPPQGIIARELPASTTAADYLPGDIVSWRLPNGLPHVGIVARERVPDSAGRHYIIHNIGQGPRQEDRLFAYKIAGHYRFASAALKRRQP